MILLQLWLLLLVNFLSSWSKMQLVGIMRTKAYAVLKHKNLGWSVQGWC